MLKKCISCNKNEDINNPLMKRHRNKNGIQYYSCRYCNNKKAKKYRKTKIGRQNINRAVYKSIKKYPRKNRARGKLYNAVRSGIIIRSSTCERCKKHTKIEGHHTNYNKPLKVGWLCKNCHSLI